MRYMIKLYNNINGLFERSRSTIGFDLKKYKEYKINKEIQKEKKSMISRYRKWCKKHNKKVEFTKYVIDSINNRARRIVNKRNGFYKKLMDISFNKNIKSMSMNNQYLRDMYINSYEKENLNRDIRKHHLIGKKKTGERIKIYFHNLYLSMLNISKNIDSEDDMYSISMSNINHGLRLLHGIVKYNED